VAREDYQSLYGRRWRRRRAAFFADPANRLCVTCKAEGLDVAASVADHIIPHHGDRALFLGQLQALCSRCHDSLKQREERSKTEAVGADGWPIEGPA
jgi:5-methylcytosine-specific restriction protein A